MRLLEAGVILTLWFADIAFAGDAAIEVKAQDLHAGRAKIIGYLGQPLGKVVTIRGRWYAAPETSKLGSPSYRVTHINRAAIAHPVEFTLLGVKAANDVGRSGTDKGGWDWVAQWQGSVKPPEFAPGEEWEFDGVETCATYIPVSKWKEGAPVAELPDPSGFGFHVTFKYIRARRLNPVQRPAK